ncbi:hypothetical protein PHSY_003324 [Pseudozyma hubeiensis SY62]|uniref:Uncharacterized protein n=1 Tax=Pseudozyma hubeiensis (strain SY62) TaxID=1305764 RepID=R9P2V0_PSEHS|nr:hypothetical protein PHSY_003324 [Pseudozyma hubeiensis SY62]GAC95748.1 hypothetical protein PHSY_003324 [Pseudozyma hubeiensis SY62]
MPAVRTVPRDVLIRVPKVEPYSNSYVSPAARAKEEAKKIAAAAVPVTSADGSVTVDASAPVAATADSTNPLAAPTAATTADAASSTAETTTNTADADGQDRNQRGNSPTLPFLSLERPEEQTVDLSKAATSSAGWNSLLVWARRQRGAQWDASTALWQVDKYSREYYSFCQDPATTDRSKQPGGDDGGVTEQKDSKPLPGSDAVAAAEVEDDDDKGPTARSSSRGKVQESAAGGGAVSTPVSSGRSIRLLRR